MKRKTAFTLVELLVVIAIPAILATVSIVGYTSFIKKGKLSNDEALVTQWNTLLEGKEILAQSDINEKLNNVIEVKTYFNSNGTGNDTFIPKSDGYHFYWCETDNNVYLVDDSNGFTVKYPESTTVTAADSYRLDKEYYSVTCSITGITVDKKLVAEGATNVEITLTATNVTIPSKVKIGDSEYTVTNSKITVETITADIVINGLTGSGSNSITVTFDKQDGTGGTNSVNVTNGQSMPTVTTPTSQLEIFKFDGYYSEVNGGGTKYYNADGTSAKTCDLTADTTLYARWIKPLTFTANTAGSSVTPIFYSGDWSYSTNGIDWTEIKSTDTAKYNNTTITLDKKGDKVYLRGTDCTTYGHDAIQGYPQLGQGGKPFIMTGSISASGDVTSITNGVGGDATLTAHCYEAMFQDCSSLTTAPVLPATTLAENCYYKMFYNCTSLTTAPNLPATTLAENCYNFMFNTCSSLTTAPALPATTLAKRCYYDMFQNCTSLTTAPKLPATTLADECYNGMFLYCTSLTTAPALPATELAANCYIYMFKGCSKLTTAPALPATELAARCYQEMFRDCEELTTAPTLPATELANSCYKYMFKECSKLKTAPELPATTLADSCYEEMFINCTSLTVQEGGEAPASGGKIVACPSTTEATNPFKDMFLGTAGTFKGTPAEGKTYYWYKD